MNIYLNIKGIAQLFSIEQIKQMLANKQIQLSDLGCVEGQRQWLPLSQVSELQNVSLESISSQKSPREVGLLLSLGIVFLPYIFSWFILRRGYSTTAKILSFVWLGLIVILTLSMPKPSTSKSIFNATEKRESKTRDGSSDKITMSEFNRLETGMTYYQAAAILGKEGTKNVENKFGDVKTELYHWDCGFMCGVDLYFSNDELTQKVQTGLTK